MRQNFGRLMDFLIAPWKAFPPQEAKTLPITFCLPYLGGVLSLQPRCPFPACWRVQPAKVNEKLSLGRMPTATWSLRAPVSLQGGTRATCCHWHRAAISWDTGKYRNCAWMKPVRFRFKAQLTTLLGLSCFLQFCFCLFLPKVVTWKPQARTRLKTSFAWPLQVFLYHLSQLEEIEIFHIKIQFSRFSGKH